MYDNIPMNIYLTTYLIALAVVAGLVVLARRRDFKDE
jgi:hypothetical protein